MMTNAFPSAHAALQFLTGGNATLTLTSKVTGQHFTFKVQKPTKDTENGGTVRDHNSDVAFVKVLTGDPNNWSDWQFIGTLFLNAFAFRPRKGTRGDAPSFKAFAWTVKHLIQGAIPDALVIQHAGSCCRCGRVLTHPTSIATGIGPECVKHFQ